MAAGYLTVDKLKTVIRDELVAILPAKSKDKKAKIVTRNKVFLTTTSAKTLIERFKSGKEG